MTAPLWTLDEIARATGGRIEGEKDQNVSGISIDTRTLQPGDLFVPLSDKRDGHDFVDRAFQVGAAAALVAPSFQSQHHTATLIRVDDPMRALEDLGRAARARLDDTAVVIAVTGSVGKTGTKDMLRAAFSAFGPTHAADKSYNNHWGVPLTLARTPADAQAAIFEIGMNHAGEISPLTQMVQPHLAIITTVEPVHLEFFDSVDDIARAKAEIFDGLGAGGTAILNIDNPYYSILQKRAEDHGANIITFGEAPEADVRLVSCTNDDGRSQVHANVAGSPCDYVLEIPGAHVARNSLAILAALQVSGRDVDQGSAALAALTPGAGRGAREVLSVSGGDILLIDESYNANPASMRAALGVLGSVSRQRYPRRIAILGDMLELGDDSDRLHAELADTIRSTETDLVFASGEHMASLFSSLPAAQKGAWAPSPQGIVEKVLETLQVGDVVMIKGSLGSNMALVLAAIRKEFGA